VIVDVPVDRPAWLTFLQDLGFQTQRPFTRMVLGCEPLSAAPRRQYAIAGPEMG